MVEREMTAKVNSIQDIAVKNENKNCIEQDGSK